MKAWRASICISPRDATNTKKLSRLPASRRRAMPRRKEAMRHKLRTEAGRSIYKMRKAIVEPVFGQIKEQRGFRRFSLRGTAECSPRVEAGVPGVQSAQAVRLRVEAAAGIKSGRKLFRRPAQTCQPQSRRHHIMVFPRNARS